MKRIALLIIPLLPLLLASCHKEQHFITDDAYRAQVHTDFEARKVLAAGRAEQLFDGMDTLDMATREALEFLYAYMPYSDLADYDQAFYLQQVRAAFAARERFAWGDKVPEDIFRHFVLVYRVNNENLDSARMLMQRELAPRVEGLSMYDAALEVNHWCHEHVAYRASDSRTSSPLATMRTSLGRCGEESTFAVTALRSVGIPARQCYTPRWAHCDDNHAWVEVWIADSGANGLGRWYFMGACEPDAELDMGWFAVPSTRCMMVHSNAFGRYRGSEEVNFAGSLYSKINMLGNYAPTRKVTVTLRDAQGAPVRQGHVKFKLYNYSEFYPLADVATDAQGRATLTTGLGDLLIWADDGTHYQYAKLDVRESDTLTLYLTREKGNEYAETFDIVPPEAGKAKVTPSDEKAARNAQRIAYEDSVRAAYVATFPDRQQALELVGSAAITTHTYTADQIWELIHKSEGNYIEIAEFMRNNFIARAHEHYYDYLKSFSDKDLRDISCETLEEHITGWEDYSGWSGVDSRRNISYEVYRKGIMPARVSNELVRPYRAMLNEELTKAGVNDVNSLKTWILKNIAVDDTGNYYNCPISPCGVFELRHSDAHSRDIFFVAACRSLEIPAYLDNATNVLYVWDGKRWMSVTFEEHEAVQPSAMLTLTYRPTAQLQKPTYWVHFSLAKYENGDFVTFDFEDDERMNSFPAKLPLEPGYYCLTTGNRYPDGEVLVHREFFNVTDGERVTKAIVLRPLTERRSDRQGSIDPNLPIVEDMATLADYAGETGMLFVFLGDYREPSKHLVKELQSLRKEYAAWGGMIYLAAPAAAQAPSWKLPNTDCFIVPDGQRDPFEKRIVEALKLDFANDYPLVALVDKRGTILFHSQGYSIGLAEQILKATP
ncbi:MAG: transglutaminase-like domain-containing protein [Bacteroidales bacterium]|nr:transglutaminase-like domain-containing protein [Bacteroidales bacterium]